MRFSDRLRLHPQGKIECMMVFLVAVLCISVGSTRLFTSSSQRITRCRFILNGYPLSVGAYCSFDTNLSFETTVKWCYQENCLASRQLSE